MIFFIAQSFSGMSVSFWRSVRLAVVAATVSAMPARAQRLIDYVDPFIGTGGHGHTYPGATVPFGMVQLSPDNGSEGWDWCSGYNYSDNTIAGFSHTHLSGTGCGDWTDISVMPNTELINDTFRFFKVGFSHANEHATPGYYGVKMNNGVEAELTATERCGLHKYKFPTGCKPVVRFQLSWGINWDSTTCSRIFMVDEHTIVGYRYSTGWAKVQRVYFAARTSAPIRKLYVFNAIRHSLADQDDERDDSYNGELQFNDLKGKPLMMKVALSSVSMDKAQAALNEIKDWDFDGVRKDAEMKWEQELAKIKVKTSSDREKRIFYTALYHTCMAPVLYSDADGEYRNAKDEVHKMQHGQRYTVFSLWDTFRGLNPLFTLIQPQRNTDILNSMLAFSDENGLLPVWDLSTWETNCMSGYHAVPVLADAVLKNTPGLDPGRVYAALRKSAFQEVRGTPAYIKYGYLPQDKGWYSVTLSLEYAFDDWCIAQVAKKLKKMDDYTLFMKRAMTYKTLFDKQSGFIRPKNSDGNWVVPFDPYFASTDGKVSAYEEGNAWQYTFFVPHDVQGLGKSFGSYARLSAKLDSLFSTSSQVKGESAPPDVSGLIGQYAHGNEPSHHIAYMYSFFGQSWKTQARARFITDSMYHDQPDGYAGNEDCGQMSAWAVWSMMGMFPANPASGQYVFGSPVFDELTVQLPTGLKMTIVTHNNSKDHPYIQSVKLNGRPYTHSYITHATLLKGGKLELVMGSKPNKKFGASRRDWPSSASNW